MAGGGGEDYAPVSRPAPKAYDCSKLTFEAYIASPVPTVVSGIEVGDECEVVLHDVLPAQVIEVWTRKRGDLLGGVIDRWAELRDCLSQGRRFGARIITVKSPVLVRISPKGRCSPNDMTPHAELIDMTPGARLSVGQILILETNPVGAFAHQVQAVASNGVVVGRVPAEPACLPQLIADGYHCDAIVTSIGPSVALDLRYGLPS